MKQFVSMKTMTKQEILKLLARIEEIENGACPRFLGDEPLFVANLFYEPSTRTKISFEVAERKLGLEVLDFHLESSSVLKGESTYDTAKTFEAIGANVIVVRHPVEDEVKRLSEQLSIPVINAGDGAGEHPTQSLLDLYTMYQEYGSFEGLNVTIVGDVVHSRVAKSNAYALRTLGANVRFSSKEEWQDPSLDFPYVELDDAVQTSDVVMLLRIQLERHQEKEAIDKKRYLEQYGLTKKRYSNMKPDAIVMHPAPVNRGVEIADELVEAKKSRIYKQMTNGVYARMAVLEAILTRGNINEKTYPKFLLHAK